MEEDVFIGLTENRRKNGRFEGRRDLCKSSHPRFSLHFPMTSSRELLFLFFK